MAQTTLDTGQQKCEPGAAPQSAPLPEVQSKAVEPEQLALQKVQNCCQRPNTGAYCLASRFYLQGIRGSFASRRTGPAGSRGTHHRPTTTYLSLVPDREVSSKNCHFTATSKCTVQACSAN